MAEFRALREGEWPEAMSLWTRVFGDCGWIFDALNDGSSDRSLEHTRVAIEDGKIVAAVDVFMRHQGGADGAPLKVGGIGSVATDDAYRGRGLSGQLLKDAIRVMEEEGCAWSMLFTGVPQHYARYGWVNIPMPRREATFIQDRTPAHSPFEVRRVGQHGVWPFDQMAPLYESFNTNRPMAHVRDSRYWDIAIRARIEHPERVTWACYLKGEMKAYAVAGVYEQHLWLHEACGDQEAMSALFDQIRDEMLGQGIERIEISVPNDTVINEALSPLTTGVKHTETGWAMGRPIAKGFTESDLMSILSAQGMQHYSLDDF